MRVGQSVLDLVGQTPLVRLNRVVPEGAAEVYLKLEFMSPGGSLKDRAARWMILAAEREGLLKPGATIIEPTSGNTGIGLAMVAAARGYKAIIIMPSSASQERVKVLQAYGAEVLLTPAEERMPGAIRLAEQLLAEHPDAFMPQQFNNPNNPQAHRESTAPEILEQTAGRLDGFVATAGTGGTITGTGDVLKQKLPQLVIWVVEPKSSPVLAGGSPGPQRIPGLGPGFIPSVLNTKIYEHIYHADDDESLNMARQLARSEGLLVGPSSGAATVGAITLAQKLGTGKRVVAIAPDSGERYLSTELFSGLGHHDGH